MWNNSGHVGPIVPLPSGFYELILTVTKDNFGVEVDKITLNFNCDSDPGKLEVFPGNITISVHPRITITTFIVPVICLSCTSLIGFACSVYLCITKKRNE